MAAAGMNFLIAGIQQLVSHALDGLLWPVSDSPWAALVLSATVLGLVAGWSLRWLTPRSKVARLKEQIQAEILALRLFGDQSRVMLHTLGRLMLLVAWRALCFLPGVVILLPVGLLIEAELKQRLAIRPLMPGERALITVKLNRSSGNLLEARNAVTANWQSPASLHGLSLHGPVRNDNMPGLFWGIRNGGNAITMKQPETKTLQFRFPQGVIEIGLVVAGNEANTWPVQATWAGQDLVSVAFKVDARQSSSIAEGNVPVERISIDYPPRVYRIAGLACPWWGPFLVIFCVAAWLVHSRWCR